MSVRMKLANVGKAFLNRGLGVMTERQIKASTLRVGRQLKHKAVQEAVAQGGEVAERTLREVYQRSVPKGITIPAVTTSRDVVEHFRLTKNPKVSKENLEIMFDNADGFFMNNIKTKDGGLIYTSPSALSELPCVGTHEFRHAMDFDHTIKGKFCTFLARVLKKADKPTSDKQKALIAKCNQLYVDLQMFACERLGDDIKPEKLVKKIGKMIQERMENSSSENVTILQAISNSIKKEVSAYRASGRIERLVSKLGDEKSLSDSMADVQEQFLKPISVERNKQFKKLLASPFKKEFWGSLGKRMLKPFSTKNEVST